MKVGIVLRDKAREVFVKTISRFFDVIVYRLPEDLPEIIDDEINFPEKLFKQT